jgi:predicted glycoside hydrolase/deacetylase ChbG (UPF0249 family)
MLLVSSLSLLAPSFERRMRGLGMAMPDFFTGVTLTGRLTRQALAEILRELPQGVTEVMCHPGYCDSDLQASPTRLRSEREEERESVSDGAWLHTLRELGIDLTSFGALAGLRSAEEKEAGSFAPALRDSAF